MKIVSTEATQPGSTPPTPTTPDPDMTVGNSTDTAMLPEIPLGTQVWTVSCILGYIVAFGVNFLTCDYISQYYRPIGNVQLFSN